jgi:GDPmannose 4,6-dehydratase
VNSTPTKKAPRRALITGITGQDGLLLCDFLIDKGYEVIGFGRRNSIILNPRLHDPRPNLSFAFGDLADSMSIAAAISETQPDELYNLASQSAPGISWSLAVETGEITGLGAHRLFEAVRRLKPACRIYQASSSEMFGDVLESPQNERTPFNPLNPYAAAKVYAHKTAAIYRRSYGMYIACGILFNHESPLRGMQFLTQKVAYGAACAKLGITNSIALNEEAEPVVRNGKLTLGNLDAARDWGHARDYVDVMWRMLQQEVADDFVIGTGVLRSVRQLCEAAYAHVGRDWREHVISDPRFVRISETGPTVADATKARKRLRWAPLTTFEDMVAEMVDAHLEALQKAH